MSQSTSRAVIYARISTSGQEEGTSLDGQLAACTQEADKRHIEVTAVYTEILSGGLYLARPQLQAALQQIESGAANILLVHKLDRGSRDVGDLRDIRKRVERAGGQLIFADGMQFDQSPVGNLMFTQLGAFAEFEREVIRERCHRGMRRAAEAGRQPARSNPPYGYHIVRKKDIMRGLYTADQEGKYIVVPEEAVIVKEIFERYDRGESLRSISRLLHERGLRPRGSSAGRSQTWHPATLGDFLANSVYYGRARWGRHQELVDEARLSQGFGAKYKVERPESEWHYIEAPAIIDKALWQRVQKRMKSQTYQGARETRYLASGLLHCPECGGKMNGNTWRQPYTVKSGEKRISHSRHYRCYNTIPKIIAVDKTCHHRPYNANTMDALIIEAVLAIVAQPRVMERAFTEHARQAARNRTQSPVRQWEKELADLNRREEAAAESKIEAKMKGQGTAVFDRALEDIAQRRRILQAQMAQVPAVPTKTARERTQGLAALVKQAQHVLLHPTLPDADKRDVLQTFIERIDILSEPVAQKKTFMRYRLTGLSLRFHSLETDGVQLVARYEDGSLSIEAAAPAG